MGVSSRKSLPLPAPTETETNTTPTDLTTTVDGVNPGDEKSSYSIPEDGTPVTIATRGHKASKSQTSLLIEYFEGGKSTASDVLVSVSALHHPREAVPIIIFKLQKQKALATPL
ncbi:hypothetical protein LB503_001811 [Fusarium chuoi]|nr:hypothetical protein LB503_001811 [Fusarium chuoi]